MTVIASEAKQSKKRVLQEVYLKKMILSKKSKSLACGN
jgi:hypothetical protein